MIGDTADEAANLECEAIAAMQALVEEHGYNLSDLGALIYAAYDNAKLPEAASS
jgi:hypothetical protein